MEFKTSKILETIQKPSQVHNLNNQEKRILCDELRKEIISATSKNGGHLASNLGVVELTVALFSVFNIPEDTIIWDVGHQCYSYKLLTGRYKDFSTIRTQNGLTGFPDRDESVYDTFTTGHSSASLSSAFGVHMANQILGNNNHTIAVIGDGALTGGLAFEGLNNIGRHKKNFIVILNDNNMSISKNVGSMSRHLSHLRVGRNYLMLKSDIEKSLYKIPKIGKFTARVFKRIKGFAKKAMLKSTFFEDFGFAYYGPYDGHDLEELTRVLTNIKQLNKPVVIHIKTTKGKGYSFAQTNPKDFHGVANFDIETGEMQSSKNSFSKVFGNALTNMAVINPKICAITAAMSEGTGLNSFAQTHKNRFFDVGIAEAHATTFAAGLSAKGLTPVFAVYSTFLQRAYDSIVHDIALQNLKVIFAIDRAGFVGEDGKTHQGLLDISMFKTLPNVTMYSPSFFDELDFVLQKAIEDTSNNIIAIRYPRGHEGVKPTNFISKHEDFDIYGNKNADTAVVCYGRVFSNVASIKKDIKIIKLNKILPINNKAIKKALKCKNVLFVEEAVSGIAETFGQMLNDSGFKGNFVISDIKNPFVEHAPMDEQLKQHYLDSIGITKTIEENFE